MRPINGRVPWATVNRDGTFSIEFSDAPDDFSVSGHSTDSNGFITQADASRGFRDAEQALMQQTVSFGRRSSSRTTSNIKVEVTLDPLYHGDVGTGDLTSI
ncbi:MAG TPA: hypothetical protein VGQ39_16075 [Pyrinomonadaceae bacterium]|jgi:uncharacterized lipoprotein YajG|nr:hypothetical protein [Pyrinomonadaceae bacterium]